MEILKQVFIFNIPFETLMNTDKDVKKSWTIHIFKMDFIGISVKLVILTW